MQKIHYISRKLSLRCLTNSGISQIQSIQGCSLSTRRGRGGGGRKKGSGLAKSGPPPPTPSDPWEPVKDEATGEIYYWNTITDETTALGDPKPTTTSIAQQQQQQQGIGPLGQQGAAPGFMGMVAQGMAFGAGSSIAHNAIGSMFGGSGGGGDDGGGDDSSGDDGSWDI